MKNVNYSNTTTHPDLWKLISENIIDNNSYFFTKNRHWKYEKESRLVLLSSTPSNGEILHHDSSLVKGVIFGTRRDNKFKTHTIEALKENRRYSGKEDFLSFDTLLNKKNEIEIASGTKHTINNIFDSQMKDDEITYWNSKLSAKKKKASTI